VTDEALMEQFCQGDVTAFDALFTRHASAIRGYLQKLTGQRSAADDLTQATFMSLLKARGRFIRGSKFKPWLYAIATNAARDWRRRGKHEVVTDEGTTPDEAAEPALLADPGLEKVVRAALEQLPEAQREAIVLHRFEGLSYAEIAETAGVTESAVKVRAHRGAETLRTLLKGAWEP
jgi:RNA polymerase sigma-70 factor (ECF subfamily)